VNIGLFLEANEGITDAYHKPEVGCIFKKTNIEGSIGDKLR
jgi:hypothetical protein